MKLLVLILTAMLDIVPGGKAYMKPLQQRDSILVADQLEYGVELEDVKPGVVLSLPDLSPASNDTLTVVRNWQVDTLAAGKPVSGRTLERWLRKNRPVGIRASVVLAPFEEGIYQMPSIPMQRVEGDKTDTLVFEGMEIEVKTMPVDTATFVIHDIKGQIRYPLTFKEAAPWAAGAWLVIVLAILLFNVIRQRRALAAGEVEAHKDPAYIVALRQLDKYSGDKLWAPEKQKGFYSGITDTLKTYIEDRFSVDAPEMTTAELFDALKDCKDISPDLYNETRALFECADFVKFAKHTADDEDNAKAVPTAVRFVTSTYQTALDEEAAAAGGEEAAEK